jgi:hypothetical protein
MRDASTVCDNVEGFVFVSDGANLLKVLLTCVFAHN